ncbi:alpha-amylase [Afipia sp. P52-10]|jgi:maltose alpha-D-glucosyltransferase/alpha-amylase|uniref:maltose alpha-D-glucosyltransferase n=1 Tax=Afipia sp. P52-10 TaxID=1429916 RepID=UPI0003DF0568|nr:maltose alpha-D-glucosyltransferase [Afipia sp. P52-10]ETR78195.1 alpha-amylase [Afipia sp. P52-10]
MNVRASLHRNTGTTITPAGDTLWYKDAIIYQLHVKAFADSNNDGIGDFAGLIEKLDYLQDLGVTALWLMPFYPSPGRDDGYDIADYGAINPDFGTMKDFRRFIAEAKRRGLRVITELVINHTSDQHPWFRRARRSPPGSSARDWYVWSDSDQKYKGTRIVFPDVEKSNWTWDPEAKAYYWHRFFSHQPDLNFDNPRVVDAVSRVMKRWLEAGVDGFRLDAVTYLCEREGTTNDNLPETHAVIKHLRKQMDAYAKDRIFLAEANLWPEDVQSYFGNGDECHMAYHFPLMPRIYMAIAQEDRFPIADILRQTPDIPFNCQWAMFLRNHDELTLEMVTDSERDYLWSTYAADPRARINLGIRRRLAPLMDNDRRKIELMNSLLLSFPGTPIVYYGDEIGMGDNIYLGDRNGVRTPMQWSPDRNGGFSRADPARLFAPVIMDPVYGYEAVNVEAQSRSISSLLSWMKRLIAVRKSTLAFGRGSMAFVRPSNRAVLAYVRQYQDEVILCVANLSRSAQAVELDLSPWKGRIPLEMLGRAEFPTIGDRPYMITLAPYGFYWFKLTEKPASPLDSPALVPEFETLVIPAGSTWESLGRTRGVFDRDVLPTYFSRMRWFAAESNSDGNGNQPVSAALAAMVPFADSADNTAVPWLAIVDTQKPHAGRYLIPMQIDWHPFDREQFNPNALAAVRQGSREGTLLDVAANPDFIALLLQAMRAKVSTEALGYRLEFEATGALAAKPPKSLSPIRLFDTGHASTTVKAGDHYIVKIQRKLESGVDPEIEVGSFLSGVAGFANTPALLGTVKLVHGGHRTAIASVHAFIQNQGDAWAVTASYLDRFIDEQRLLGNSDATTESDELLSYQRYMALAGKRVAEMQTALASRDDIEDFRPEAAAPDDVAHLIDDAVTRAKHLNARLRRARASIPESTAPLVDQLLAAEHQLYRQFEELLSSKPDWMKIRTHGDLHLAQMLVVKDDIYIINLEGEPHLPLAQRRRKGPAARDVAGVIRSIDYSVGAVRERMLKVSTDDQGRLGAALESWRAQSITTFLHSYDETLTRVGLWPQSKQSADRMLHFFLLQKAVQEIDHELRNRPDWLRVPLAAALRLLQVTP